MLEADTRVFVNRMLYHVMLNATINLIITNNFAFGVKVILSPESTHPDDGTKSRDERTNGKSHI